MSEFVAAMPLARARRGLVAEGVAGLWRRPFFLIAVAIILVVTAMALFPQLFSQLDPRNCDLAISRTGPSAGHIMGLRHPGLRLLHQRRVRGSHTPRCPWACSSPSSAFSSRLVAGSLAGYFGGVVDSVISWVATVILGIPVGIASLVILYQFPSRAPCGRSCSSSCCSAGRGRCGSCAAPCMQVKSARVHPGGAGPRRRALADPDASTSSRTPWLAAHRDEHAAAWAHGRRPRPDSPSSASGSSYQPSRGDVQIADGELRTATGRSHRCSCCSPRPCSA